MWTLPPLQISNLDLAAGQTQGCSMSSSVGRLQVLWSCAAVSKETRTSKIYVRVDDGDVEKNDAPVDV